MACVFKMWPLHSSFKVLILHVPERPSFWEKSTSEEGQGPLVPPFLFTDQENKAVFYGNNDVRANKLTFCCLPNSYANPSLTINNPKLRLQNLTAWFCKTFLWKVETYPFPPGPPLLAGLVCGSSAPMWAASQWLAPCPRHLCHPRIKSLKRNRKHRPLRCA